MERMERSMDRFSPTADAKAKGDFIDLKWNHSNGWLLSWHPGQPENQT